MVRPRARVRRDRLGRFRTTMERVMHPGSAQPLGKRLRIYRDKVKSVR